MDDTAAGIALGVLGALLLHGAMNHRAARAAERQMDEAFTGTGAVHAIVREHEPFGIVANDIWAIDIYGSQVHADGVPFTQIQRSGWKGRIHHLRLHLKDCGFAGLQFSSLDADIPTVTYDLGHALYKDRLLVRSAGVGAVRASVEQSSLADFAQRKYGQALRNITANMVGDRISITGEAQILGSSIPFSVEGPVIPRSGRYLDVSDPLVKLNGVAVNSIRAKSIMDRINPVLDMKEDLHLERVIRVKRVEGVGNTLVLEGEIRIPGARLQEREEEHSNVK